MKSPSAGLRICEAALADRGQVRAARDERDVMPRPGELRAVVAADGTRSEIANCIQKVH